MPGPNGLHLRSADLQFDAARRLRSVSPHEGRLRRWLRWSAWTCECVGLEPHSQIALLDGALKERASARECGARRVRDASGWRSTWRAIDSAGDRRGGRSTWRAIDLMGDRLCERST